MIDGTINNDLTMSGASATVLVNRYRVIRQLGQGGMGSVWLAEDTQLDNRPVAIKMLPSVLVSNKRAYAQLKAEALVSLKLTHPNIATVRAFEENNGNPFLVVDYIDGVTLDDYLAEYGGSAVGAERRPYQDEDGRAVAPRPPHPGGLPEAEVIRLLMPIAAALDYAHSKGVIHRDVKPGNVMIAKDGTPYILDFGIAREIQETMTRVTGKLSSGTLMYMSPEQLHGAAPTPAQDVYSFAAMAYECLTGHPPFTRGQIEYQIEHDDPETLPSHIAISDGIMAGLAKRPEGRSANCAAVLAGDGGRGATALPVHDETAAASDGRARTPAAPHTPSMPHEDGRARAPRIAPPSEFASLGGYPRGPRRWPVIVALFAVVILVGAGLFHFFSAENEKRRNLAVAQASYERVRVSLKEQLRELQGVSHEDGFGSRIEEIKSQVPLESTLRDAPSFLRAVECCERLKQECRRLVSANALRVQAKTVREVARKASQLAQSQSASQDAQQTWQNAEAAYAQGQRQLSQFDFDEALRSFKMSGELYERGETQAAAARADMMVRQHEARDGSDSSEKELLARRDEMLRSIGEVLSPGMTIICAELDDAICKVTIRCLRDSWSTTAKSFADAHNGKTMTAAEILCQRIRSCPQTVSNSVRIAGMRFVEELSCYDFEIVFRRVLSVTAQSQPEDSKSAERVTGMAMGRLNPQSRPNDATVTPEVKGHMQSIVFAQISFGPNMTMAEAVKYLHKASLDYDRPDIPFSQRGVRIVLVNEETDGEIALGRRIELERPTLLDTLQIVCNAGGFDMDVRNDRVYVRRLGLRDESLVEAEKARVIESTNDGTRALKSETNGHHGGVQLWKDGPYWAECNVGASKPEEYGYYFWWGDTVGYKRVNDAWQAADESRKNFSFSESNCPTYGKDNSTLRELGYIDATGNLVAAHDAATAHLGAPWRMPTNKEIVALVNNCTTEWMTSNGVPGLLVAGKGSFSTKSIFLPASGFGLGSGYGYGSCLENDNADGYFWSSTLLSGYSVCDAWCIYFASGNFDRVSRHCYIGRSVRPLRGFAH